MSNRKSAFERAMALAALSGFKVALGPAFLAAAQQSSDPNVRTFGEALRSADDADLYVDSAGGYPVAFRGSYTGAFDPLKFDGDFSVQIDLTGVNQNTPVSLPSACNNPISR